MIEVHDDVADDLEKILLVSSDDASKLIVFIEQLQADASLIRHLLDNGFGDDRDEPISVKKWISVNRVERLPVWRLRAWDLEKDGLNYRFIYFFNWMDRNYYIMALVPRGDLDYDDKTNEIRLRVIRRIREEFPGL